MPVCWIDAAWITSMGIIFKSGEVMISCGRAETTTHACGSKYVMSSGLSITSGTGTTGGSASSVVSSRS